MCVEPFFLSGAIMWPQIKYTKCRPTVHIMQKVQIRDSPDCLEYGTYRDTRVESTGSTSSGAVKPKNLALRVKSMKLGIHKE